MHHTWPFNQDLWLLYHKVTFDGINRTIIVNDGVTDIDVQIDLYSDWKEWALQRDHLKFEAAMRSVGGDPTVAGNFLGSTFFTINNWKILISNDTNFVGNLFSDDFLTPFVVGDDTKLATSQVSNLIDKIGLASGDLISAGVATSTDIDNQTTIIQTDITNQTTILGDAINNVPSGVVTQLNQTTYDGVPYADLMGILLSMAQGRINESSSGVFEFYAQDNSTILYTLTKSGNQRLRT